MALNLKIVVLLLVNPSAVELYVVIKGRQLLLDTPSVKVWFDLRRTFLVASVKFVSWTTYGGLCQGIGCSILYWSPEYGIAVIIILKLGSCYLLRMAMGGVRSGYSKQYVFTLQW
jgi:hypothetical protein